MQQVNWPNLGDRGTFRRRSALLMAAGLLVVGLVLGAAALLRPALVTPLAPLCVSMLLLHALWVHGTARSAARRREVERSFGGLVVLHAGAAFHVADRAPLGEFASRRHAARAAIDRGGWAVIIQAWDRYYVLACRPASEGSSLVERPAFSFRSRAVADVVPAIDDRVAMTA
ncbi:MAG: hypothetical protein H7287_07200 [Thermoleophilia bacterium]|nr:hypothetical protein [Thermoleophilia bacterium]